MLNKKQVQLPDEKLEMFYKPKINPIGKPPTMWQAEKQAAPSMSQYKIQQRNVENLFNENVPQLNDQYSNNPFKMNRGDITLSTTMPTKLVKQMMNSSYQQPQQKFCTNPFCEPSSSNQNFYERNLMFQQQQQQQMQMQSMKRDFQNISGMSTGNSTSSSSSTLSAYEANMQQQYAMLAPSSPFHTRFEPPKPDTPPSKPLWLDPVWNCDGNFFDSHNACGSGSFGNSDSVSFFMLIFISFY